MPDDREIYAALTEQEFNDGCAGTYEGVGICEDEAGYYLYAWGHVDPALMLRAVHAYASDIWGVPFDDVAYSEDDVDHRWAQTIRPTDDPDGWLISFADDITADSPHAWAVTIIEQG